MPQPDQDIRGLLHERLAHQEAEPGRDLWPEIEQQLQGRKRGWVIWLAVAASVLVLIGALAVLSRLEPPAAPVASGPLPAPRNEVLEPLTAPADSSRARAPQGAEPGRAASQPRRMLADTSPAVLNSGSVTNLSPVLQQAARAELRPIRVRNQLRQQAQADQLLQRPQLEELVVAQAAPPAAAARSQAGEKNSLALDNLSLNQVVSFAANELNKWSKSPIDILHEKGENEEVHTYQLDLFNFRITKKNYKRQVK
ncbi:MAG: hypothetical protein NW241_16430 [Bacteroidia bacterium]|nr:hypothetical protein [Bacteroidia bacterium]